VEAGLIAADAVVYLRVSADDAAARRGYGKERYERVEMQRSIQTVFEEELVEDGRAVGEGGWAVVDGGAGRTIDEVGDDVWSAVNAVCSAVKLKPMRVLWE
jgi:dTMP kinase